MDFINETTKKWIEAFIDNPKAPLLLQSNVNLAGATVIVDYIHSKLSKSSKTPVYTLEKKDKNSIGIADVRELINHLSLRANKNTEYSSFILIKNMELLTVEAQNAILKLIEELPPRTVFMMITDSMENILQTIKSRTFTVEVLPISDTQAYEYANKNGYDESKAKKAYLVSDGSFKLYKSLLEDEDNELYRVLDIAKEFIGADIYTRQLILKAFIGDKDKIKLFLNSLQLTTRTAMRNAKTKDAKIRWKNMLTEVIKAKRDIEKNVQTKLALLSLSVSI